jgi:ParB-like chromosome segregation protein Spo0J
MAPRQKSEPTGSAWAALQTELRPVEALASYERNARKHSPEQIAQIMRSLKKFGWTIPVLVDEGGVLIAGHGRIEAARKLAEGGDKEYERAPVAVARGWTEEQKAEYRIIDNRLAELSEWDKELLAVEVRALEEAGEPVTDLGFTGDELSEIMSSLERPGSFLDALAQRKAEQEVSDAVAKSGIMLNLPMLPADRDAVLAFLNREREARGLKTAAEALVAIAIAANEAAAQ